MKIRGTPAHIAEKYIALSRDAQSNGDRVLSENYLQHAEHYNRIILAYRDQQAQQQSGEQPASGPGGSAGQHHRGRPQSDQQPMGGEEAQPVDPAQADQPASGGNGQSPRRSTRGRTDRQSDGRARPARGRKPRNADANEASDDQQGVPEHEQPEFLRRSVRRPAKDTGGRDAEAVAAADDGAQD